MLTTQSIYEDGFLDGMRNCGFLASDVPDINVRLNDEWKSAMAESYINRNYTNTGRESSEKLHEFAQQLIKDNRNLLANLQTVTKLLEQANSDKGALLDKQYETA